MADLVSLVRRNLSDVRGRIDRAATRAARSAADVQLVAVTKYASAEVARELLSAGCLDLGESRP
ncbi:MAG: YggS family pyridoxal phosphate-dependent enzyme, partial [Pirellulales bacterium]